MSGALSSNLASPCGIQSDPIQISAPLRASDSHMKYNNNYR